MLGPVFRAELLRTARRRRYYVLRALYGLVILLAMWLAYQDMVYVLQRSVALSYQQMARFAAWCFQSLMIGQGITLLLLIPAIVGGVIADEKQRKTLHYLMASQLSSGEIVCDKLAARLLHLGVFVAIGIPVVCLIGLFGGVSPEMVVGGYSITAAIVFFASVLAVLVSTYARTVRQAVLMAYIAQIGWLAAPFLIMLLGVIFVAPFLWSSGPPPVWLEPAVFWVASVHPVSLLFLLLNRVPVRVGPEPWLQISLMFACHVSAGILLLWLAIRKLRPVYLRQETTQRRLDWFPKRARKGRKHPACGERAVLWRECWVARTDVFTKMFVFPATILLTVFLIFASGIDEWFMQSIRELLVWGNFGHRHGQLKMNLSLRFITPPYLSLWLLAVAGFSASSVTSERERDTWISLVSSPLSGREIMLGKLLGGLWSLRGFGALLGLFWIFGLIAGGLHPLGFLYTLLLTVVLTLAVAALGLRMSLTSKTTSQALAKTLAFLFLLNAGYMLPAYPWIEGWRQWLGCTPYLAAQGLWSYEDLPRLMQGFPAWDANWDDGLRSLWISVTWTPGVIGIYAMGGFLLALSAVRDFDRLVGRPRKIEGEPELPLPQAATNGTIKPPLPRSHGEPQRRDPRLVPDLSGQKG